MKHDFDTLKNMLTLKCGDKPVYYFSNPGNFGDALIRDGTLKLFKDIGLKYQEIHNIEFKKNFIDHILPFLDRGTIIYGGGGGWCKQWNHSEDLVSQLQKKHKVIVLPSTYESAYALTNTTFLSRDKYQSKEYMPNADFYHDMAFYIGKEFSNNEKGNGKGYFFRTDTESANKITLPPSNQDISLLGDHLSDIRQFFNILNQYLVIYTDRLHVSIAAALLNKEVHLYPGSYFKNSAIYKSSMQDYFDKVHFHEDFYFDYDVHK